ncbi:hypothetical protein BE15_18625 [Sorangium cellulosum]|uniref:Uncharacterized protein n=1 Tax=Sorangium cellulosum TaxID=56 RepID=A0A150Q9I6_SORCE|nr:hypothetical protein BE15_18625 [Sorangium cellulosum]
MPSARSTSVATSSALASSPSAARTSRSLARRVSGGSIIWLPKRPCASAGNMSCTSGRPRPSTRNGRSFRLRSAASTIVTVGRSPHCRSSRISSTGCFAHSARMNSSHDSRS